MKKVFTALAVALATTVSAAAVQLPAIPNFTQTYITMGEVSCAIKNIAIRVDSYMRTDGMEQVIVVHKNNELTVRMDLSEDNSVVYVRKTGEDFTAFTQDNDEAEVDAAITGALGVTVEEFQSCGSEK